MKGTNYNPPDELKVLARQVFKQQDKCTHPHITDKLHSVSWARKKELEARSFIPQVGKAWRGLSQGSKDYWEALSNMVGLSGYQAFVQENVARLERGLGIQEDPNLYHQGLVGRVVVSAPASEVVLKQSHQGNNWYTRKVVGSKNQLELYQLEEGPGGEAVLSVNSSTALEGVGGEPYCRLRACVHFKVDGDEYDYDFVLNLPLVGEWANHMLEFEFPSPGTLYYNLFIELHDVRGQLLLDNLIFSYNGTAWARDPRFDEMERVFTGGLSAAKRHWEPITLPAGASFGSVYPEE